MVTHSRSLEELFYAGAHSEILKSTVDSATGEFPDEATFLVVGALVFTGRAGDAATVFRSWEKARSGSEAPDLEQAAACRFFLCVAECRAGRYLAAEKICRTSLTALRGFYGSRARYFFHQGMGLVRHFTGRIGSATRHAARARRYALEARFPYGRMLALDLLGHTQIPRGKVLSGLTILEQAADLASSIGLESFAGTTRSAIVGYRAHYGMGESNPVGSLLAHLAAMGEADRYSRRLILTDLAEARAFRGEAADAARDLRNAEDVALPDGDRRVRVRLHLARALVTGFSLGEEAANQWLLEAAKLIDPSSDAALDVEIAWHEYLVCPARFAKRRPSDLATLAEVTAIARAQYLAAALGVEGKSLASEDRFAALVRSIRHADGGLDLVLEHELYGFLPMCFERAPGQRIYIDVMRGLFAMEDHGNIFRRDVPSAALLMLLRSLARGPQTKEVLIREVWRLKVYRPEQHDAVVHTAISRLRTAMDPYSAWIQATGDGYALAPSVELIDVAGDAVVRTPLSPREPEALASEAKVDPRRAAALALVERDGGAATRDVAQRLKVSEMTAFRLLNALVSEGAIERSGRGRNTKYTKLRTE